MSCVNIRGCRIGEGRPKVILPIVERTEAAILEKAAQFSTLLADCVEWRADWFEGFQSPAAIARCVQKLRGALRDKLLLVTFRTKAEGGEQALSHPEYLALLGLILDTDCADLLDIEFFTAGADLPKLVEQAHSAGGAVVWVQRSTGRIDGVASMVFVLAVFLISIYTDGYFWGVMASLLSVRAVIFAFRSPYFAFNFTLPENLFSGLVMLVVSIMTSTLTTRIKMQEQLRMESETE